MDAKLQSSLDEIQKKLSKIIDSVEIGRCHYSQLERDMKHAITYLQSIHKEVIRSEDDNLMGNDSWQTSQSMHAKDIRFFENLKKKIPDDPFGIVEDSDEAIQKDLDNLTNSLAKLNEEFKKEQEKNALHPKHENKPGNSFEINTIRLDTGEDVNLLTITRDKAMEIINIMKKEPQSNGWAIAVIRQLEAQFPEEHVGTKYIQEFREMKRKERENSTKVEPTAEETVKKVFKIDVGDMSPAEAYQYTQKVKREINQRNPATKYDPDLTKAKLQEGIDQEISNRAKQIKELQEKCDFSIDSPDNFVDTLFTDKPTDYVDNLSESMRSLLAKYNKQFNCMFAFTHPVFAVKNEITKVKDIVDEFAIFGNLQYSELYTQISGPFVNSQDVMKIASEFKDDSVKNKDLFTMIRYDGAMKAFLSCNQHLIHELNNHARFNISDYMMNDLQRYVDLRNRLSAVIKSIKGLDIKIGPIQEIDGIDTDIATAHMEIASNKMRDFFISKMNELLSNHQKYWRQHRLDHMKKVAAVEGIEIDKWKHIIYAVNDIVVKDKQTGMNKALSVDGTEQFTNMLDNTPLDPNAKEIPWYITPKGEK